GSCTHVSSLRYSVETSSVSWLLSGGRWESGLRSCAGKKGARERRKEESSPAICSSWGPVSLM
ncbi:MAG: hypothetical protein ACKESB_02590, partial [Candidatus Hodgkinia cicadicola]